MIFFTSDHKVILGLCCEIKKESTEVEDKYLQELKEFTQSEHGYINYAI